MICPRQRIRNTWAGASVGLGLVALLLAGCRSSAPSPESPAQIVERARLLLERGRMDRAAGVIRRASRLDPRNPAVSDGLGDLVDDARAAVRTAPDREGSDHARILLCAARDRLEAGAPADPLESRMANGDLPKGDHAGITPPEVLYAPGPRYTSTARRERYQGDVVTHLIIDEEGCVVHVEPVPDAHFALDRGHGMVNRTVETQSAWVYRPALLDGEPVAVFNATTTHFRLQ